MSPALKARYVAAAISLFDREDVMVDEVDPEVDEVEGGAWVTCAVFVTTPDEET